MNRKVRNVILLVLIFLVILSAVIVTLKLSNKGTKDNENVNVYVYEETNNEKENDQKEVTIEMSNLKITLDKENEWFDQDKYYTHFKVILKNDDNKKIENISLEIDFKEEVKIEQNFNFTYETNNNILKISLMEYNKNIEPNNEIELGIIISTFSPNAFENLETKLYIDNIQMLFENDKTTDTVIDTGEEVDMTNKVEEKTPLKEHGKLKVNGVNIIDSNNNKFVLKGISTHGIYWFGEYVSYETFKSLRDFFGANTVRLAMYSDKNAGYTKDMHEVVKDGVKYATDLGMYVIIDWHILSDNNPNTNKEDAKVFFEEMSLLYKDYDNVIYEICNEPNGDVLWERDIKPYAEEIIKVIRKNDEDAIIIVGTPNYSQDVDIVANSPIENETNIMYALHFYAATHKEELITKAKTALSKGLPLFVSEFGICDATGNGNIDKESASKWMDFLKENDISYVFWNLSNKKEASAIIKDSVKKTKDFIDQDLTVSGIWIKEQLNK